MRHSAYVEIDFHALSMISKEDLKGVVISQLANELARAIAKQFSETIVGKTTLNGTMSARFDLSVNVLTDVELKQVQLDAMHDTISKRWPPVIPQAR